MTDTLDRLVSQTTQLYTLPAVAVRVLELTNNPGLDTRALKECLEHDPALTTKILRVVNSSLFGLGHAISDLNQALALLGTKPLKLLVLGFSLPPGLYAGLTGEMLAWYWRRTLTKAVAAREITETLWRQLGDEAFLAGLLQDLGMLVMIQQLGPPYVELLEKVRRGGGDLQASEMRSLGFDHTMLTSALLAHWQLPKVLVESVCRWPAGEKLARPPAMQRLTEILTWAELLVRLLVDGHLRIARELLDFGQRTHDLSPDQLAQLVAALQDKVRQLANVFSLKLPEGLDYSDVLARSHAQLAEAAEAIVEESSGAEVACLTVNAAQAAPARPHLDLPEKRRREAKSVAEADLTFMALKPQPAADHPDPELLDHLAAAIRTCRHLHCPISLVLVELMGVDELVLTHGPEGFERLRQHLGLACQCLDHPGTVHFPHHEAGFALVLPNCERRTAIDFAKRLIEAFRVLPRRGPDSHRPCPKLGVGVATLSLPPRNSPPRDLFDAASHCLYGSFSCGGGIVRSIEIL